MEPALVLDGVGVRYGQGPAEVQALRGVRLVVEAGEFVAVMGPSGSGKTTLLHVSGGLEVPTAGRVVLHGTVMPGRPFGADWTEARRRRVGVVFQRLNLLRSLTVLENVVLPLELAGTRRRAAAAAGRVALGECGLEGREDSFPDDLSGGEQQRVAIARAVVGERSVVLADEPTGALDSTGGERIVELLADRAAAGTAVVLATHDSRVASWADRVVFLHDGSVVDQTAAVPEPEGVVR